MKNTSARYGRLAQVFHWTTVGLLLITVPVAWVMVDLPNRSWQAVLYNLHQSIGVTLFGLTVLRWAWRHANPVPDLPASLRPLEVWLARLTHGLLYVILFAMPASGYLMMAADGDPIKFLGLVSLSPGIAKNPRIAALAEEAHVLLQYALYILVALHVSAALNHHFLRRDGVLSSMLPARHLPARHPQPMTERCRPLVEER